MGFYNEAKNSKRQVLAIKKYEVWNPNVQFLYEALGRENPYGEFSGKGEEIEYSLQEIERALEAVETYTFHDQIIFEKLHPLVASMCCGYKDRIDKEREKKILIKFLQCCREIAEQEGKVTIYFG